MKPFRNVSEARLGQIGLIYDLGDLYPRLFVEAAMTSYISPPAGKPAPLSSLIDVATLVTACLKTRPDPSLATQRVAFGTPGHRGPAFDSSFNGWHVLGITQSTLDYHRDHDISRPLFLGIDTHALPPRIN